MMVFVVKSMKECMTIFLLSNELYTEWGEILLMWEHEKILDGFGKLPDAFPSHGVKPP